MARQIRVPLAELESGERQLDAKTRHYLCDVLRLRAGEVFVAFDADALCEADARLGESHDGTYLSIGALRRATRGADSGVVLIQALAKADKIEQVVRSATALAVAEVHLVESARSVARAGERSAAKRARLESIALDAARQSGRADVPKILGPHGLGEELAAWRDVPAIKLCLTPGASQPFRSLTNDWSVGSPIAILVGPEGGLAPEEVSAAEAVGFVPVSFGELVLRTEVAGLAVLGALILLAQR